MALPLTDPVLVFALLMLLFLAVPLIAERMRVPGIIGLIVAGAVVGPHGINLLARDIAIVMLGTVGLLYLVFEAGLELDIQRFVKYRQRSLTFGVLSFGLPMLLALLVFPWLGFGFGAAALIGAIIGSHTLLAYPIVSGLGLVRNDAVTTVLGGTLVTDTLALGVLAVVAGAWGGDGGPWFWASLFGSLALYVAIVLFALPRLGRWFFRSVPANVPAEFLFLMAVLFITAYGASLAGAQPLIGAFLAGLTLNRLIPSNSPLMTRVRFVGNALFVPFFLISVGMLVDTAVLRRPEVWLETAALTALLVVGKAVAAWLSGWWFRYGRVEVLLMFGLSVPQAAATLAVTLVGLEIGLLDTTTVNAVVLLILITGLIGPVLVERQGRALARREEDADDESVPERILVPLANPSTADDLLALAMLLRSRQSDEPLYPMTVVPGGLDAADSDVAQAERMLGHAVLFAAGAEVPVRPLTHVDRNVATGIVRGIVENRITTVVVGWDGMRSRYSIFGRVLDQLLARTRQLVLVTRIRGSIATTRRVVAVAPPGTFLGAGGAHAARTLKCLAHELDADLLVWSVESPAHEPRSVLDAVKPPIETEIREIADWNDAVDRLRSDLRKDDLVIVMSRRERTAGWSQVLGRLPGTLATLLDNSFLVLYPPEPEPDPA